MSQYKHFSEMSGSKCICICFLSCLCGIVSSVPGKVSSVTFAPSLSEEDVCAMPARLRLEVTLRQTTVTLRLRRARGLHAHAPLFHITKTNSHQYTVTKGKQPKIHSFSEYQDGTYGASISVTCPGPQTRGRRLVRVDGTMYVGGAEYRVQLQGGATAGRTRLVFRRTPHLSPFNHTASKFNNLVDHPHKPRFRFRRAGVRVPEYNIDVLVVVDYLVFRDWQRRSASTEDIFMKIREYFAHVMNGVNLRYKSVVIDGYRINVHLVGYVVSQSPDTSPWTESNQELLNGTLKLSADRVLETLKDWVNRTQLPAHDHVMLFTGYDLYGDDGGSNYTTGLAFIGTMCQGQGRSVSVVEDHGGFQSVATAAHELGHRQDNTYHGLCYTSRGALAGTRVLGAEHDGDNNTCTPRDRYIMAGASFSADVANRYNPWHFSPCSVRYFTGYIQTVLQPTSPTNTTEAACLRNGIDPVQVPDVSSQMPGQLLKPDDQCRQMYGVKSYMCRGKNFGGQTDICRAMFCRNPATANKCILHTAARGTTCANNRWCVDGMCVYDEQAPPKNDACLFGDRTGVVMNNRTCGQMVAAAAGYCYMDDFTTRCCESCRARYTGVPGCEFGDRVLQCSAAYCGRKFDDGNLYDVNCCGTCDYKPNVTATTTTFSTTETTTTTTGVLDEDDCMDYSLIDNKPCIQYVNNNGRSVCYYENVQQRCCKTCETLKITLDSDCPWGDQDPAQCRRLSQRELSNCRTKLKTTCCASCAESQMAPPPPGDNETTRLKGHNSGSLSYVCLFTLLVSAMLNILNRILVMN